MRLLPDEDQADYARQLAGGAARNTYPHKRTSQTFANGQGIVESLVPESELELRLAQSIADDYWRIDRIRRIEQTLFFVAAPDELQVTIDHGKQLNLYTLYESRLNRNVRNNLAELRKIQADRRERIKETGEAEELADPVRPYPHTSSPQSGIQVDGFGFPFPSHDVSEFDPANRKKAA